MDMTIIIIMCQTIGPGGSIVDDSGENGKHASICTDWMIKFPVVSPSLPVQRTLRAGIAQANCALRMPARLA